jgi:VanZ family protein
VESIASFLRRWGLALLLMTVIFGFSSIPSNEMPNFGLLDFVVKKGGHALGYGLLALSYLYGLKGTNQGMLSRWLITAWFLAVVYSTTDEFHQSFVPGRHPVVTDVLIDAAGAAIALLLTGTVYQRYGRSRGPFSEQ